MPSETDFPTDLQLLELDYELIREIGQGGMAAVYLARRRDSGRLVAIKAIRARYLDDPDALARFAREARTVAGLDHPNIVRTEAIEQIGDRAVAIIMEHIAGGTVRDRLRERGAFGAEHAESVLRDVAHALGYAHRRGIVHRDVKPENVFLDERTGRALLSDFGIARRIEGDAPLTLLGAPLGTPQYMSPEQIETGAIDGRSDIYSLGVLGWELLTGRRPWAGESLYSIIYKQKHEDLPRITSIRPRVPANLLFAIEGALAKDPARRWQSTDEFLAQLTYEPPPVLAQEEQGSVKRSDDEPTVRFRRVPSDPVPVEALPPADTPEDRVTPPAGPLAREGEPHGRRPTRAARRASKPGRSLRAFLLVVPLAIAGTALYVVFGDRRESVVSRESPGSLTSSGGAVALDTTPPASPPKAPESGTPPTPSKATPPVTPAPPVERPGPRCQSAAMADQRACLLAYIAVNDTMLQRVYDSLIVELRRDAGVGRGQPDPPAITRLRIEQRGWIAERDRTCTRDPAPGSSPFWAERLSTCFARMSANRATELREAFRRPPGESR